MSDDTYKKIFSKKLRYYMELNNKTQMDLMNDLGLISSTVSSWYNGQKMPRMGKIQMLADYFGINKSDLIEDKSETTTEETFKRKGVKIPVLGEVAAGVPLEAIEDIIDYEEITEEMAQTGEFFGLKIKGDSMYPRICDGDVVIVRQQNSCDTGDVVVVLVNGEAATVKKIRKQKDGIMLIPFNTSFEPMFFSNEEIQSLPVNVIGKVIELRGKF